MTGGVVSLVGSQVTVFVIVTAFAVRSRVTSNGRAASSVAP